MSATISRHAAISFTSAFLSFFLSRAKQDDGPVGNLREGAGTTPVDQMRPASGIKQIRNIVWSR